jgi:O-antigen/teichoic acid export membrane protein
MAPEGTERSGLESPEKRGSLVRTVVGGTGLIAAAGGVSKLLTLVSAPILTAALGPSPYGVVALLSTVTSLAMTVALLGIDQSYARFFFAADPEEGRAAERFCWRFSLIASVGVATAAGAGWWWWSGLAGLSSSLAVMVVAGILLGVWNAMATTRRRLLGGYFRIAVAIIVTGALGAILAILLALYWRQDAWSLLVGSAAGVAAGAWVAGFPAAETVLVPSGLSRGHRIDILRLGAAGAITAPVFWLMGSADRWIIAYLRGSAELGVYAFASTVGMVGMMLNSAITLTWFPEMTREYESAGPESLPRIGMLWVRLASGLMVAWIAVSAAGGDVIRLIADPRFHGGTTFVPWIAGGIFFYGIASLANTGLLLKKDLTPSIGWWVAGAVLNLGMNLLLVPPLGGTGAAMATCAGYGLIAVGVMRAAQARLFLPIPWKVLGASAAVSLVSGMVMIPPWSGNPALSLTLKFPVGVAALVAVLRISAREWFSLEKVGEYAAWLRDRFGGSS